VLIPEIMRVSLIAPSPGFGFNLEDWPVCLRTSTQFERAFPCSKPGIDRQAKISLVAQAKLRLER
jgi:hypothetical protein